MPVNLNSIAINNLRIIQDLKGPPDQWGLIINGNKLFDKSNETKIHKDSFKKIKFKFKKKYPKLKIELKLISLNKKIENF